MLPPPHPQNVRYYLQRQDPDFGKKVHPTVRSAYDEKPGIQALARSRLNPPSLAPEVVNPDATPARAIRRIPVLAINRAIDGPRPTHRALLPLDWLDRSLQLSLRRRRVRMALASKIDDKAVSGYVH